MIAFEEMEAILDEIATEFPQEFYKDLNGGIILLPEAKLNNIGRKNDLYILGEYHAGWKYGEIYIPSIMGLFIIYMDILQRNQ